MRVLVAMNILIAITAASVSAFGALRPTDRSPGRTTLSTARSGHHAAASVTDPNLYDVQLEPPSTHRATDNNVFITGGALRPGTRETKPFVLPRLTEMSVLLLGQGVTWSFRSPGGTVIVPGKTRDLAGYEYGGQKDVAVFSLEHPETGSWTATIEAIGTGASVEYGIIISSDDPAAEFAHLETMPRESGPNISFAAMPGDPVFVRAFVAKDGRPVPGTIWDVSAVTPSNDVIVIPVYDDGHHADGLANDGVSVGAIVAKGPDGIYQILAKGRTPPGVQYTVTGTILVEARNDLLIADSIAVSPEHPRAGEPVTLTVTAKNDGTVPFKNVELALSIDLTEVSDQKFDLEAGESRRITTTWVPSQPLDYNVQLTLTSYDEHNDFTNNMRRMVVRVR